MLGIADPEIPASQVGNRKYARGRAYDPDRFKEVNEEQTAEAEEVVSEAEVTIEENTNND